MSSQSLASAKKRRTMQPPPTPPTLSQSSSSSLNPNLTPNPHSSLNEKNNAGYTIHQIIDIFNKRIFALEKKMNDTNDAKMKTMNVDMHTLVDEIEKRCEILAEEVINLKNIVLNLQFYTMNVNKMLLEEKMLQNENVDNDENENNITEEEENIEFSINDVNEMNKILENMKDNE